MLSALCRCARDGRDAERGEDVYKQRGIIMETTSRGCMDNGKKETMIINCSEMRTEGTSQPFAGMPPRD